MNFSFEHTSKTTKMILIGEFLLVSYLLYALAVNVYQSYQIDSHIQHFRDENEQIAAANNKAAEDLLYYTSDQYLEKIAKQNLGVVNPGEEVIVLSENVVQSQNLDGSTDPVDLPDAPLQRYYHLSNPQKWWKFFFEIDHRQK
jgi:cell division protein FtsB